MEYIKAIILGVVQGLAEFLPISSSGHLVIFHEILGSDLTSSNMLMDVMLHLGTLTAVIIVYKDTIWNLIKSFFKIIPIIFSGKFKLKQADPYQRMVVLIIISLLPLFLVLPFTDAAEALFSSIRFVGFALLLTSILLLIADKCIKSNKNRSTAKISDAVIVGLSQACAVVPGLSRSGTTISVGLLCGFERSFAAEFSFIMSLPAIIGANALTLIKQAKKGISLSFFPPAILGAIVSSIVGFLAIKLINLVIKKDKFIIFEIYCAVVGAASILYSFFK